MKTRIFSLVTLAASLAACSSIPDRNIALEEARGRFNSAQRDSQVTTLAADELNRAGESLRVADQAWTSGAKTSTVDHLSYLAAQRVIIARETASGRASQAITTGAAAERDQMRLALRTQEADAAQRQLALRTQEADKAQQQLALSQQSNAQKQSELAAADASAQSARSQAQRSDARANELEMQLKELNARKTERGIVVTLGDTLFDSGQARLLPEGANNMAKLAEFFKRYPQRTASIEGHTDSVGSASANYSLSQRRADAVMTMLVNLGVASGRLSTKALGQDLPTASNDTAAGRQLNRRVEIVFAPQSQDVVTN